MVTCSASSLESYLNAFTDEYRQFIFGTAAVFSIPGKLHSNSAPTRLTWLKLLRIAVQYRKSFAA
jgi:hypothetical protein